MDLIKIKLALEKFSSDRNWDQYHSVKNLSMALSVECSELLEIFQWMSEVDSNNVHLNPVKKENVEDEVADIFIYLFRIANKLDINLEEAINKKMEKNALKYPVEVVKGSSKKYTEY